MKVRLIAIYETIQLIALIIRYQSHSLS